MPELIEGDEWGAARYTYEEAKEYADERYKNGNYKTPFSGAPGQVWVNAYNPALNGPRFVLEPEYRLLLEKPEGLKGKSYWEMGIYKWRDALKLGYEQAQVRALNGEQALQHVVAAMAYFKKAYPTSKLNDDLRAIADIILKLVLPLERKSKKEINE